ncbi:hypothetical protein BBJ28_00008183 [Nothophytophthora sp. Chile5]|nr:hypothetical protein BBJ28_00008183 [Nothophytophthora sp. Chile5]
MPVARVVIEFILKFAYHLPVRPQLQSTKQASMEPMHRAGDSMTDYEKAIIKELARLPVRFNRMPLADECSPYLCTDQPICSLLSYQKPTVESIVFGVTLLWDTKYVAEFVAMANSRRIITTELPVWFSQPRGQITANGFMSDTMASLKQVAGGLAREDDLAPNTMMQSDNIYKRLGHIEMDPFVQACVVELNPEAYLASVLIRYEYPEFGSHPANFQPPPSPYRLVFR